MDVLMSPHSVLFPQPTWTEVIAKVLGRGVALVKSRPCLSAPSITHNSRIDPQPQGLAEERIWGSIAHHSIGSHLGVMGHI